MKKCFCIDTLLANKAKADQTRILNTLNLQPQEDALLTLHRPSNVAVCDAIVNILHALEEIQHSLPLLFPVHPRTRKRIEEFGFTAKVQAMKNLHLTEPLGYLDFLKLTAEAQLVLTDSGGIQEETTILQVPCLTLRENTDRPLTLE